MKLRQAKKRLWWSKGEGDYISNHRSKNHHENYKKKYLKLRPEYYDEKRGGWVYPSCADIDIVRRANVRLGRWIRKGKKYKEQLKKDMKELINVAEKLYKQIDKAQVHLINARLQKDEEGKKSAISEMETAMCNTMQLLKCFIDRKDNIVDLGELWHNKDTKPEINKLVVFQDEYDEDFFFTGFIDPDMPDYVTLIDPHTDLDELCHLDKLIKWAYIDDLLPKGGE